MDNIIDIFISLIFVLFISLGLLGFVKGTVFIDTRNNLRDYTLITLIYTLLLLSNVGDLLGSVSLLLK